MPYMTRTHSAALGYVWTPGAGQNIDMHYDFPVETGRKNSVALVWAIELDSPVYFEVDARVLSNQMGFLHFNVN